MALACDSNNPVERSDIIMLVDLSVEPARQEEFDRFYHEFYIPEFLRAVPEVLTARRFAQTNHLGSLDKAKAHFLTIYELRSDDSIDSIEAAIARSAHRDASDQFKLWKQNGLTYFDRAFYRQVHKQISQAERGTWDTQYLCIWKWSARPDMSTADAVSSHSNYASEIMSSCPSVVANHTYLRMDAKENQFLTYFELDDELSLAQLAQGAAHGRSSNQSAHIVWSESVASVPEAMSLVRIYTWSRVRP